jgi:hypothetical protein
MNHTRPDNPLGDDNLLAEHFYPSPAADQAPSGTSAHPPA